jgi:uncharacterized protein (TIGR02145 family)
MNGMGEFYFSDVSYYVGEFVNGRRTGNGKVVFTNGQIQEGLFENDIYKGVSTSNTVTQNTIVSPPAVDKNQVSVVKTQVEDDISKGITPSNTITQNTIVSPPPIDKNQVSVVKTQVDPKFTTNLKSVVIGTQTWTTENLNVSTFRNGDPIPEVKTNEEWITADNNKQPAWCYPEEGGRFGKLYNYYAVNDPRGLAPFGWHIPTIAEWGVLGKILSDEGEIETYGVLSTTAGKKIKSISEWSNWQEYVDCDKCSYWTDVQRNNNPCDKCRNTKRINGRILSGNGSNSSKLSCYPVAGRNPANGLGKFSGMKKGIITFYWSISKEISSDEVYCVFLLNSSDLLYHDPLPQGMGLAIRCIKD